MRIGLFVVLLFSFRFAESSVDIQGPALFLATQEACRKVKPELFSASGSSSIEFDKLYAGRFPTEKFTRILDYIRYTAGQDSSEQLNVTKYAPVTLQILKSPHFAKALRGCYPNTPRAIAFFYDTVKRSDRAGKTVSVVKVAVLTTAVGRAAQQLTRWSSLSLKLLKISERLVITAGIASLLRADQPLPEKVINSSSLEFSNANKTEPKDFTRSYQDILKFSQAQVDQLKTRLENTPDEKTRAQLKYKIELIELYMQEVLAEIK